VLRTIVIKSRESLKYQKPPNPTCNASVKRWKIGLLLSLKNRTLLNLSKKRLYQQRSSATSTSI
jgi:hypothetical protein